MDKSLEQYRDYEVGYCDGYKEGFNKACEPVIQAKMLQNTPIILHDPSLVKELKQVLTAVLLLPEFRSGQYNPFRKRIIDVLDKESL